MPAAPTKPAVPSKQAGPTKQPGPTGPSPPRILAGRPELGRGNAPVNAFRNGGFPPGMPRNGLPHRPFPGEPGFTGVPPRGETRYVTNEMIFHVAPNVPQATVDAAARRLGLVTVASQNLTLAGGTLLHFRIANGRPVSDVVRELEGENIGIAQPNYVYRLQQDARTPAPLPALTPPLPHGDPSQYAVAKLHLVEAHKLATGADVLVAVIDSQVDTGHPDLGGTIAGSFDAVGNRREARRARHRDDGRDRRPSQAARRRAARAHPRDPCLQPGGGRAPRRPRPRTSSPASTGRSPRARGSSI